LERYRSHSFSPVSVLTWAEAAGKLRIDCGILTRAVNPEVTAVVMVTAAGELVGDKL